MRKKHTLSHPRLERIIKGMKTRCYNQLDKGYHCYGGRGITICDEWLGSRDAFIQWAFDHGYADDLSIDRIDNNQGYRPDNCRWATSKQQSRNMRGNVWVKLGGKEAARTALKAIRAAYGNGEASMRELARQYGIALGSIHAIIHNRVTVGS